ncbi:MAG: selenocysteine-specific translation elongation factor [Candidatus Sabulitectum sp.]|nr:selenocysteine-specific translation elongation factor [Candidatus Sabulitectum sp.]
MGVIIGTAGHIDHGKSSLMLALTGVDPDRLKEEKARGITIELGYVFLETVDGESVSFIDVPGHEKFVKTMVAGVSTVDSFLLVVSADEGVMPQTVEHLDILRLLEVNNGIVALSKCDLVDDDLIELAEEEVREALLGTPAESSPIMRVSAKTGFGMKELKKAIIDMAVSIERKSSDGRFRMPVDRIFTLKGFGTIVCGTGLSGKVNLGDSVEIRPVGKTFRVRELGVNEQRKALSGEAGDRIALNLTGVHKEDVHRGSVVGEVGFLKTLNSLDTICTMLQRSFDLMIRQRIRFHVGTAEVMARAIPVEGKPLLRGETGYVHFQLEHPVVAMPGDRFVIRRYSPVVTIGGGIILDTGTQKVRSRFREARLSHLDLLSHGDLEDLLFETMEDAPGYFIEAADFTRKTGSEPVDFEKAAQSLIEQDRVLSAGEGKTGRLILKVAVEALERKILGSIRMVHRNIPLSIGLPSSHLARKLPPDTPVWTVRFCLTRLQEEKKILKRGDFLCLSDFPSQPSGDALKLSEHILSDVRKAGIKGVRLPFPGRRKEDIEALLQRNLLVYLSGELISTEDTLEKVRQMASKAFDDRPFRLGELREALGVSRKITLMWAEIMDNRGFTRRDGENRFLVRYG